MRKILIGYSVAATAFALIATPAVALGIGDLAKVVLGNSSVLKKGEEKCGTSLGLTKNDSLAMTFARSAVEQSLPISQFLALDKASQVDAATTSATPTFCNETKKKKSGLMKAMTKAGKSILKQKALGGLGL
jgi:antitoxin component of RelBE/YafQ-DinJ toxin-antitoxin module